MFNRWDRKRGVLLSSLILVCIKVLQKRNLQNKLPTSIHSDVLWHFTDNTRCTISSPFPFPLCLCLFGKCHLAGSSVRLVKLYLIKMLCSLPNSYFHMWFSLGVFCGWALTSTLLNQCFLKQGRGGCSGVEGRGCRRPSGSHSYMLFGMTGLRRNSLRMCP